MVYVQLQTLHPNLQFYRKALQVHAHGFGVELHKIFEAVLGVPDATFGYVLHVQHVQHPRTPISALCAGEGRPEVLLLVSSSCTLASHTHSPLAIWDSDAQTVVCPDLARDADLVLQLAVDAARLSLNDVSVERTLSITEDHRPMKLLAQSESK